MKYIITENKLIKGIYEYIDSTLKSDNVFPDYLYEKGKMMKDVVFFVGDSSYMPEDIEDMNDEHECYFKYVTKKRYIQIDPFSGMVDQAPALWMDYNDWRVNMDRMFDKVWHETFKHWFRDKYPQFPVKSFYFL